MPQLTDTKNLSFFEKLVLKDYSPDEAKRILEKRKEFDDRLLELLSDKSRAP